MLGGLRGYGDTWGGMGACDAAYICRSHRTRLRQEPLNIATACTGRSRGKTPGGGRDSGGIIWRKCGTWCSSKFQDSLSFRNGDIVTSRLVPRLPLVWLAPVALKLALRYLFMCVKYIPCHEHSLPPRRYPCLRIELRVPAATIRWICCSSGSGIQNSKRIQT